MKAKKFDADFDSGKDVTAILDISKARRPLQKQRRINVDFPDWMIESLDKEASELFFLLVLMSFELESFVYC